MLTLRTLQYFTALVLLLTLGGCAGMTHPPARPFSISVFDELTPLCPDSPPEKESKRPLVLSAPRGALAGCSLLLHDLPASGTLQVTVLDLSVFFPSPRLYQLLDVPVEINTGLESRTEKFDGRKNPYVIRRAPFRVFEVLRPVSSEVEITSSTMALAVQFPIPLEVPLGGHELKIRIAVNGRQVEKPLRLEVFPPIVPPIGRNSLCYTNWFSPDKIARSHGVELWSEDFWAMLDKYAALMAQGRQNTFLLPLTVLIDRKDGQSVLNTIRAERFVNTFIRRGMYYIECGHLAGRAGGDWNAADLEVNLSGKLVSSPEGRRDLIQNLRLIRTFIEDHSLQKHWIQHIMDEPENLQIEKYRGIASLVREYLPDIPILDATISRELTGSIDIWCPTVDQYQLHREFFDARKDAGDRVWVYTCLTPGGPWINRLLDQERLRPVYVGWGAARYGNPGFLHWGLNHYGPDPFKQSVIDHPEAPGTNNQLPAGDTHIVYPGPDGPWSSTRFEAHRIGLEDCELLRYLQRANPDKAEEIIAEVFTSYKKYSKSVKAYRAARRHLLEALSGEMK